MDLAAEKLGMDPLEFRTKNDRAPDPAVPGQGRREALRWDKRKSERQRSRARSSAASASRSRGGALAAGAAATSSAASARTARSRSATAAQDIGTGTRTIMAMVAAEELGIPVAQRDRVHRRHERPDRPRLRRQHDGSDHDAGGEAGCVPGRPAAPAARRRQVGHEAERARLRRRRRPRHERSAEVDELGGRVPPHSGRRDLGARQAGGELQQERRPGAYQTDTGGVHFAEVEVDTETGLVRSSAYLAMQDAGTIINPLTAESQVNGAIIQGISYALFEERHLDRKNGPAWSTPTSITTRSRAPATCRRSRSCSPRSSTGRNNIGALRPRRGPASARRGGDRERGAQRDRRARARAADDAGQGPEGARATEGAASEELRLRDAPDRRRGGGRRSRRRGAVLKSARHRPARPREGRRRRRRTRS